MNQILETKSSKNLASKIRKVRHLFLFKFQLIISICIVSILVVISIFYFTSLKKGKNISDNILSNYRIYSLYSKNSSITQEDDNDLFGIIEIPKINIYYPIFSHLTDELLKISPCKFYGSSPDNNDNICIAAHNYNNNLFFSKINSLNEDDEIYIYNNISKKFIYYIFKIYEVKNNDLSPVFNYDKNSKELTLITCNNLNDNRIIVKAKQKSF